MAAGAGNLNEPIASIGIDDLDYRQNVLVGTDPTHRVYYFNLILSGKISVVPEGLESA